MVRLQSKVRLRKKIFNEIFFTFLYTKCINRFGFSEFNSDTYGPIAFKAVASLVGLSDDPEIRTMAEIVMNLQMFDHIIGSKGQR